MENTGFKGLLVTLYQRIILSYKTTLIGVAVQALGLVGDYFLNSPNKFLTIAGTVIGLVFAMLKEKFPDPKGT